jgi:SAM-dependent methyltransferase
MRSTLTIPPEAAELILLQRTRLQSPRFNLLRKLGMSRTASCRLEARLRRNAIAHGFLTTLIEDMTEITPHLPAQAARILDIGCGVAGIDVLLHDHYAAQKPGIWLLDKSTISKRVFYGFNHEAAFYNSLSTARALLESNDVPAVAVHCTEVGEGPSRIAEPAAADLVVSLLSWGFHYPVETYLTEVRRVLAPGGRVILDARKDNDGLARLRTVFKHVTTIADRPQHQRVVAHD